MFRHTIAVLQCDVVMFNSNVAVLCVHAFILTFKNSLTTCFKIKDLGKLSYCLEITIVHEEKGKWTRSNIHPVSLNSSY